MVPIHEKDDKQVLKNDRTVSLLPIFAKIFIKDNLIPINQVLNKVSHEIYQLLCEWGIKCICQ